MTTRWFTNMLQEESEWQQDDLTTSQRCNHEIDSNYEIPNSAPVPHRRDSFGLPLPALGVSYFCHHQVKTWFGRISFDIIELTRFFDERSSFVLMLSLARLWYLRHWSKILTKIFYWTQIAMTSSSGLKSSSAKVRIKEKAESFRYWARFSIDSHEPWVMS